MFGFLLFIPTLAFMPHATFFLGLFYYLVLNRKDIHFKTINYQKINLNFLLIIAIIILCFFNKIIHLDKLTVFTDVFPYTILMLLTYFYSLKIQKTDLKILVYLICFESVFVLLESFYGVTTFIPQLLEVKSEALSKSTLLYDNRPLGLSNNSSVIAYKILLGYLLLDFLSLKTWFYQLIRIVFLVSIFLTFNRTVLLVLLIFIFLQLFKPILQGFFDFVYLKIKSENKFKFLIVVISLFSISYFVLINFDEIILQLTRGKGIDLAGRDLIWANFIEFINYHPILGNGSYKYLIHLKGYPGAIHAHNSFLQLLANNGIIISILFIILVFNNMNKNNYKYIITLMLYSLFQSGIFWGISLVDIVLFIFLFREDLLLETENVLLNQSKVQFNN